MNLNYVTGDATAPKGTGIKVIAHCCNDVGAWGAGFVMALSRKCTNPEMQYRKWSRGELPNDIPFKQGQVRLASFMGSVNTMVANIIGQSGCGDTFGFAPVRYEALEEGFIRLREMMVDATWSLHMPRIGCGLAGGEWQKIEDLLTRVFKDTDVEITVYDFA